MQAAAGATQEDVVGAAAAGLAGVNSNKDGLTSSTTTTNSGNTNNKKKRSSSKPPPDSDKATKKKKKDSASTESDTSNIPGATILTTTTTATTTAAAPTKKTTSSSRGGMTSISKKSLVDQVLFRLTEGVPRMELKAVVREADECENTLLQEIKMLEEALKEEVSNSATADDDDAGANNDEESGGDADSNTLEADKGGPETDKATNTPSEAKMGAMGKQQQGVDVLLENPLTPMDRCLTLSALLGRLRDDLALPSIRKPVLAAAAAAAAGAASKKKKANNTTPARPTYPQLVALADHPNYTRLHPENPPTQLLHVWRKIASHRTAMVFRRPVKPEEAPGYTDRILFPMDLSLVRKMIVARILTSYSQVHQRIRLISHNCVKYNTRESDYGVVAREFEASVDEYITAAVYQPQYQQETAAVATGKTSGRVSPKNTGGTASGRSSPKSVGGGSGRSSPKSAGGSSGRASPNKQLAAGAPPSAASIAAAAAAAAAALAPSRATAPMTNP